RVGGLYEYVEVCVDVVAQTCEDTVARVVGGEGSGAHHARARVLPVTALHPLAAHRTIVQLMHRAARSEIGAAQWAGSDQAARRVGGNADVVVDDVVGRARDGLLVGVDDSEEAL